MMVIIGFNSGNESVKAEKELGQQCSGSSSNLPHQRVLVVVDGRDPGQGTGGWSGGGSRGVGGRARRWVKEWKEKRKVAPS